MGVPLVIFISLEVVLQCIPFRQKRRNQAMLNQVYRRADELRNSCSSGGMQVLAEQIFNLPSLNTNGIDFKVDTSVKVIYSVQRTTMRRPE